MRTLQGRAAQLLLLEQRLLLVRHFIELGGQTNSLGIVVSFVRGGNFFLRTHHGHPDRLGKSLVSGEGFQGLGVPYHAAVHVPAVSP